MLDAISSHLSGQRGWFYLWTAGLIGLIFSLTTAGMLYRGEYRLDAERQRHEFERAARQHIRAVQTALAQGLDEVQHLSALYAVSEEITRAEFQRFTTHARHIECGLQALEWVPRVTHIERAAFKQRAQAEIPDYHITEPTENGGLRPASVRAVYFPVYYLEPYCGNEAERGLDLGSVRPLLPTLYQARDSGRIITTGRVDLAEIESDRSRYGFRIFVPIYRSGTTPATLAERRRDLLGFVVGLFRLAPLVEAALEDLSYHNIALWIYDQAPGSEERFLYWHAPDQQAVQAEAAPAPPETGPRLTSSLELPGRLWSMLAAPAAGSFRPSNSMMPWAVLAGGLLLTAALVLYLLAERRRQAQLTLTNRALCKEIDARHQAEAAQRREHAVLSALVNSTTDAIYMKDPAGRYVLVNPAAAQVFGRPVEEALGRTDAELFSPEAARRFHEEDQQMLAQGEIRIFEVELHSGGQARILSALKAPCRDADGNVLGVLGIARDISEQKAYEHQLEHQATHDELTALPNRILLQDRLRQIVSQAHRHHGTAAVLVIDLDGFKHINDSLGHAAGDQLLRIAAERLRAGVRENDTVARLGGDEFAALILNRVRDEEPVLDIPERLLASLAEPVWLDGHEVAVSASIGISLYPRDGEDAQTLLRNADAALYQAKAEGRNTFRFYHPTMNAQALEQLALGSGLRRALERDELTLYYQPQVALESAQIIKMEALVRWQHPKRGLLLPGNFIPLAERSGLIVAIGEWVLKTACIQLRAWQQAGFGVHVAVNLSARQFRQADLVERIARVIEETGVPACRLELELTESLLMQDAPTAIAVMEALRQKGFHFSIDDFGTGYSSLAYLKRFPLDRLKIDRAFVHDLPHIPHDVAITRAIIALAKSLDLKVLAEGVENEAQRAFLEAEGCDEVQGYLFGRPLPAEAVTELLHAASQARESTALINEKPGNAPGE